MIAERIREHWTEFFAATKRKQRKTARKDKMDNKKSELCFIYYIK